MLRRTWCWLFSLGVLAGCGNNAGPQAADASLDSLAPKADHSLTPKADHLVIDAKQKTTRTISGQITDPTVDTVAAIADQEGKEVVADVVQGKFTLADLSTKDRYLIDFRSGITSQGWLKFPVGSGQARVIPTGNLDIALGECTKSGLELTCAANPLDFTDDNSNGIVDAKDGYTPLTPVSMMGRYKATQGWNQHAYGISFAQDAANKRLFQIFVDSPGSESCEAPQTGEVERFGEGFIGLFQASYDVGGCVVQDYLQLRLTQTPGSPGSYQGENIHLQLGTPECPKGGCLGAPPHGGDYTLEYLGDTSCP